MKTEEEIEEEKKDWKKAGQYGQKIDKETGKLLFKSRYIISMIAGVLLSGITSGISLIATGYGFVGMFKSKIRKAYYTKKLKKIKDKFDAIDKREKEELKKNKNPLVFKKRNVESDSKKETRERKAINDLKINPVTFTNILNDDNTYSMSKEQLKYLNTVQDKDIMNKENLDRICKMYGKNNTNTNPSINKVLKKVA